MARTPIISSLLVLADDMMPEGERIFPFFPGLAPDILSFVVFHKLYPIFPFQTTVITQKNHHQPFTPYFFPGR